MENTERTNLHGCCRFSRIDAMATSLGKHKAYTLVVDIMVDGACSIGASTHTSHEIVGIVTSHFLAKLPLEFFGDNRLQAGHHIGIRMRTDCGANDVERVGRMAAPVANSLVGGILERTVATLDGINLSTEHLHSLHVDMLTLNIESTHIDTTWHIHQRTDSSSSHSMLTCTCLGHNACLAHALGYQDLPDGIVDLVGTGMVEVLALQIELAAISLAHTFGKIKWRRTTHIVAQQLTILILEFLALNDRKIGVLEILHGLIEDFRDISPAKAAIKARSINLERFHFPEDCLCD